MLDTSIKSEDTTIALPEYFAASSNYDKDDDRSVLSNYNEKPIVNSFDPRFTFRYLLCLY